jgi:hypothetical protein
MSGRGVALNVQQAKVICTHFASQESGWCSRDKLRSAPTMRPCSVHGTLEAMGNLPQVAIRDTCELCMKKACAGGIS